MQSALLHSSYILLARRRRPAPAQAPALLPPPPPPRPRPRPHLGHLASTTRPTASAILGIFHQPGCGARYSPARSLVVRAAPEAERASTTRLSPSSGRSPLRAGCGCSTLARSRVALTWTTRRTLRCSTAPATFGSGPGLRRGSRARRTPRASLRLRERSFLTNEGRVDRPRAPRRSDRGVAVAPASGCLCGAGSWHKSWPSNVHSLLRMLMLPSPLAGPSSSLLLADSLPPTASPSASARTASSSSSSSASLASSSSPSRCPSTSGTTSLPSACVPLSSSTTFSRRRAGERASGS